jgi:hypothetical protein
MDRVDIHEAYDPRVHYKLELDDGKLTAEELAAKHGRTVEVTEEEPTEDSIELGEGTDRPAPKPKRLDG